MNDVFTVALERMYQWERAMTWLEQMTLTPPIWPDGTDTPSVTKQAQAVSVGETLAMPTALTQLVTALSQVEQAVNTQSSQSQQLVQSQTSRHQQTVNQPMATTYQTRDGNMVHQQRNQSIQAQQQTQAGWTVQSAGNQFLEAPSSLTQQTTTTSQAKETTVTVSPTVQLQATVYEQADLEALVAKLNHLLEEEIAISAERAYT